MSAKTSETESDKEREEQKRRENEAKTSETEAKRSKQERECSGASETKTDLRFRSWRGKTSIKCPLSTKSSSSRMQCVCDMSEFSEFTSSGITSSPSESTQTSQAKGRLLV